MWVAYLPVVPWIAALAIRHGGLAPIAAANPGITDGGLVGESKFDILARLPTEWTMTAARIDPGPLEFRLDAVAAFLSRDDIRLPLIMKPDVGQRGAGVRKVSSMPEARAYLRDAPYVVVAQQWHPGPFEAGLFYWRHPDEPRGRISSITDKIFPVVIGDGTRALGELVRSHPRYARQASVFLPRHRGDLDRVLSEGERFSLGAIGNHCQGTMFRDGAHLWSPALEARIDEIARQIPGFHIGRFDVRYRDRARFMSGEDLAIIELNGVSAEPTDVYDPDRPITSSYRALFDQWTWVFEIGAANLRRGHRGSSPLRLCQLALQHVRDARVFPVSG